MNAKFLVTIPRRSCSRKNSTESTQPDDRRSGISPFGLRPLSAIPLHSAISIAAAMEKGSNQPPISGTKKAVPKYDLFHSGGEEGIQDPSTTRGVVISIAAAMEKGSNQPPISGTKKAAHKYDLFVMAERKGFKTLRRRTASSYPLLPQWRRARINLPSPERKRPQQVRPFSLWRRGRDSNPCGLRQTVFKTASL